MGKPTFTISVSVEEESGRLLAAYFRVREGAVADTKELGEGKLFADYDAEGHLLGLELLGPCEVTVLERAAEREPEPVKRFLRSAAPGNWSRRNGGCCLRAHRCRWPSSGPGELREEAK